MDLQELRQAIADAGRERRTKLDLWDKGLTELAPEIGQLAILSYYREHQARAPGRRQ